MVEHEQRLLFDKKDFACDADHVWFVLFLMETNESRRILWSRRAPSGGYSILYVNEFEMI